MPRVFVGKNDGNVKLLCQISSNGAVKGVGVAEAARTSAAMQRKFECRGKALYRPNWE